MSDQFDRPDFTKANREAFARAEQRRRRRLLVWTAALLIMGGANLLAYALLVANPISPFIAGGCVCAALFNVYFWRMR